MNREQSRIYLKKWRGDNKEHTKQYYQDNKEHIRGLAKKYNEEGRGAKHWKKSERGKRMIAKNYSKKIGKKWIEIFGEGVNIFPPETPIAYHHADGGMFIVPIPKKLHTGGNGIEIHLKRANAWVEFYYNMNPMDFLKEMNQCVDVQTVTDGLEINEQ